MADFRYTATDALGNRVTGEVHALTPAECTAELEAQGLRVESLSALEAADTVRAGERLSGQEVVHLSRHISELANAGLPLASGLRALGEELEAGSLRRMLFDLARQLEGGAPLDQAIESQGNRFPGHLRGLVLAGVHSGRLGEVLEQFVNYHDVAVEIRRRVTSSLAYPLVLLGVFAALFVFFEGFVVLQFKKMFMDFGVALPKITLSLLQLADFVTDFGLGLLLLVLAVVFAAWVLGRIVLRAPARRRFVCRIPWVGPLWRWISLAEFSHLLGLLLDSEIPLPTALQLAGDGVRDADIADACKSIAREVESGKPLSECEAMRSRFPLSLSQTVAWGEGQQALPEALHSAGEMFEGQARVHAMFVTVVAPPLLVIVLVSWLGFTILGLFMPMMKLITELSG